MLSLSPRTKATFLALGIFILGALCGAMGERWLLFSKHRPFPGESRRMGGGPPGRMNERLLERMDRHLDLTEDQRSAIAKILRESREEIETMRHKIGDDMRARKKEIQEKIAAELLPEQREKFDKTMRQMGRRRSPRRWQDAPPRGY
jgi:protein CpxP